MKGDITTKEEAIPEITRRLVNYFQPERVYLLGSAARGNDGPDSNLDVLVVAPDGPGKSYGFTREHPSAMNLF